jgi:tetratricopeptide (TPR) repeat protein
MPRHDYMQVDPRFDHSMRVPRPDVSLRIGTPNACTMSCHADQSVAWAADSAAAWWPDLAARPQYGEVLYAARAGAPGADTGLNRLGANPEWPAVVRATALSLLARYPTPATLATLRGAVVDPDPLVRHAAAGSAEAFGPAQRTDIVAPLLRDPVRTVRAEAGRVLAPLLTSLTGSDRTDVESALAEYRAAQAANADQAFAHLNLGNLSVSLGDAAGAEAQYRTAIQIDPRFVPAYVNLADLYRAMDDDATGLAVLEEGIAAYPEAAELHRSLALLYSRQNRPRDALASIARAAALAPDNADIAYVYALALHGQGQEQAAIARLEGALEDDLYNRNVLYALVTFQRDRGKNSAALVYARRLAALEPQDPNIQALLAQLSASSGR